MTEDKNTATITINNVKKVSLIATIIVIGLFYKKLNRIENSIKDMSKSVKE